MQTKLCKHLFDHETISLLVLQMVLCTFFVTITMKEKHYGHLLASSWILSFNMQILLHLTPDMNSHSEKSDVSSTEACMAFASVLVYSLSFVT